METLSIPGLAGAGPVDEFRVAKDAKVGYDSSEVNETSSDAGMSKQASEKGSKKKKGKSSGNSKMAQAETGADNQESVPSKSKKGQKKGKVSSGSQAADSKSGARKDEDSLGAISEEWVIQKITSLNPDFEEQGTWSMITLFSEYFSCLVIYS